MLNDKASIFHVIARIGTLIITSLCKLLISLVVSFINGFPTYSRLINTMKDNEKDTLSGCKRLAKEKTKKERIPGRGRTNATMNLANIVDNSDGQLFPTVYNNVQLEFAAKGMPLNFTQLASITAVRSILQSVTTPMWGWWSDRHSRKRVLAFGCWFWEYSRY